MNASTNIAGRLAKIEERTRQREAKTHAAPDSPCICPWGQQSIYFKIPGMTDAEVAAHIPGNRKNCPKCGGLNIVVETDLKSIKEC